MRKGVGRSAEWETGGVERMGLTTDTAGMCWLSVSTWKADAKEEFSFELTPTIAAELIAELAAWIASEAIAYEKLLGDAEKAAKP